MIRYPPDQRLSAKEAYEHKWVSKGKSNLLDTKLVLASLNNLKNFHVNHYINQCEQKLQQAAFMYIGSQLLGKKERNNLIQIFTALDIDADGKLSRDELIEGYKMIYGNQEQIIIEVNTIMKEVDADHNGYIDYSGS